ncbi:ShlB/FhaC/HecB family hemolysin secretion/activation protein [Burkholderia ubonensis]|uniref:ShlB/FhaC/HecB family hemolysin secretion/activation protein n=1 Tax=Burkholderia ubonensis TaxID=101571 RepID=UPI000A41A461|nr:ShlB/FhaC/HecB family hemolysin secretion/activation protein [Burkholderia ubonensis]
MLKTDKTKLAAAADELMATFNRIQLSATAIARSRRWADLWLFSLVTLDCGVGAAVPAQAQEAAQTSPSQDSQQVTPALEQLRRLQQKPNDANVPQELIDQLGQSQREIDSLHRTVAALQQQLREHGISPVEAPNGTALSAGNTNEMAAGTVLALATAQAGIPASADATPPATGTTRVLPLGLAVSPPSQGGSAAPEPAPVSAEQPSASSVSALAGSREVGSITLVSRDITRPQPLSEEAAKDAAPEHCAGIGIPSSVTSPGPKLPALSTQAAADNYRQSLVQPGNISAEPGIPTTDLAGLEAKLRPFIGQQLDSALIQKITRVATQYVSAQTNNLVNVYVPPQKLQNGNLVIVFAAAKLGQIRSEGQKHISSHDLKCQIRLRPGDNVDLKTLTDDLAFLNTSPWRQVSSSFTPGAEPGDADLVLQTVDRYPLRVYGSWDNTGTTHTGLNRWRTGVNWGDAFGIISSRLDYSFTMGNTPRDLMGHTILYTIPTSYRDTLTFTGDYSSSDVPIEDGAFNVKGKNIQASAQWTHLLGGLAPAGSQFTAGFEYKHVGNSLLFNNLAVTNVAPNLYQFYAGVQVPWMDRFGSNSVNARFTFAPGFNSNNSFNAARTGAESDYRRLNLTYDRYFNLPAGLVLHGRFNGQWASGPIIASEQLQISGAAAVRGYREDVVTADAGYVINLEALTPPVSVPVPWLSSSGQLQGVVFYDYGQGFERGDPWTNVALNETANRFTLASVGFGARFSINQNVSLKADVGWRLRGPNSLPSYVIHGAVVIAY